MKSFSDLAWQWSLFCLAFAKLLKWSSSRKYYLDIHKKLSKINLPALPHFFFFWHTYFIWTERIRASFSEGCLTEEIIWQRWTLTDFCSKLLIHDMKLKWYVCCCSLFNYSHNIWNIPDGNFSPTSKDLMISWLVP